MLTTLRLLPRLWLLDYALVLVLHLLLILIFLAHISTAFCLCFLTHAEVDDLNGLVVDEDVDVEDGVVQL